MTCAAVDGAAGSVAFGVSHASSNSSSSAAAAGHWLLPAAGTGNLTRHLLAAGALVTAVEKDYALSDQLQLEFAEVGVGARLSGGWLRQRLFSSASGPSTLKPQRLLAQPAPHCILPAPPAPIPCRCPSCRWSRATSCARI